jgi:hypothetical protein
MKTVLEGLPSKLLAATIRQRGHPGATQDNAVCHLLMLLKFKRIYV